MPNDTTKGNELVENVNDLELDIAEDEKSVDNQETDNGDLDLDEEETSEVKPTPAEVSAKNQEEAWFRKVVDGKASLDDPFFLKNKWIKDRVENRLNALNKEPDIEEVVERKLAQRMEQQNFQELMKAIPKLDPKTAKVLKDNFAELKPLGNYKALQKAILLAGITLKTDEKKLARQSMALPPSGQPKAKESNDPVDIAKDPVRWKKWVAEQNSMHNKTLNIY